MRFLFILTCLCCACLSISACTRGDVRKTLGIKKNAPDEFMVLSRKPLEVPTNYTLTPPVNGDSLAIEEVREQARSTLIGKKVDSNDAKGLGDAELSLLKKAKAKDSSDTVRTAIKNDDENGISKLPTLTGPKKDPIVDADKEQERIKANETAGKAVNEGDVATKSQEKGFIDIFQ